MRLISILVSLSLFALASAGNSTHGKVVVCPVLIQSIIDALKLDFTYEKVDWNLCTTIMAIDDQVFKLDEKLTAEQRESDYEKLMELRNQHPHLKITLAVSKNFFTDFFLHVGDKNIRKHFISNVTTYLQAHNFDGLDMHWIDLKNLFQYSSFQMVILKKELKESFNASNMLLTSSFSAITDLMERPDFNFTEQTQYLDFVHLLQIFVDEEHLKKHTVEFVLRELNVSNVQQKVDNLIELGVPASKIILGVNFGGPNAQTSSSCGNITEAKTGNFTGYNEICDIISSDEATKWNTTFDNETQLTIMSSDNDEMKHTRVILFAKSRIIANYMKFAVERNLAGALAFADDRDDFNGKCPVDDDTFADFVAPINGTIKIPIRNGTVHFPLLKTIHEALSLAIDIESNGSSSHKPASGVTSTFKIGSFFMSFIATGILWSTVL